MSKLVGGNKVFNKHGISVNFYQLKINWSKVTKLGPKFIGFVWTANENNATSI